METKYNQYLSYDWNSPDFLLYLQENSLHLTNNDVFDSSIKKLYYKNKIDIEFEIDFFPKSDTINQEINNFRNGKISFYSDILKSIVALIFILIFWLDRFNFELILLLCFIKTLDNLQYFSFNYLTVKKIIQSDYLHQLFCVFFLQIDRFIIYTMIPVVITCFLELGNLSLISKTFDKIIDSTKSLVTTRARMEVLIGFFLFIGIFLEYNSYFTPLIYSIFLRIRYINIQETKEVLLDINKFLQSINLNSDFFVKPLGFPKNDVVEEDKNK